MKEKPRHGGAFYLSLVGPADDKALCKETEYAIPIAQTDSNTETPIMTTCDTANIKKLVMNECISRSRR